MSSRYFTLNDHSTVIQAIDYQVRGFTLDDQPAILTALEDSLAIESVIDSVFSYRASTAVPDSQCAVLESQK